MESEWPNWRAALPAFFEAISARLERGEEQYGDESWERPIEDIDREIDEELLDIVGWAFIKWKRRQDKRLRAD